MTSRTWWCCLLLCSLAFCIRTASAMENRDATRRESCQPDTHVFDAIANDINKDWDEYDVAIFNIYRAHAVAAYCYVQKNDLVNAVNELNELDGMAPLDDSVSIARLAVTLVNKQRNPKTKPADAFTLFDEDWAYLDHHIDPCLKKAYFKLMTGKTLSAKEQQCKIVNTVTIELLFQSNKTLNELVRKTIPEESDGLTPNAVNKQKSDCLIKASTGLGFGMPHVLASMPVRSPYFGFSTQMS